MKNIQMNNKEIFLLALSSLNISDQQRNFCLESHYDNLTFEKAVKITREVEVESFSSNLWNSDIEVIALHSQHQIEVIPRGSEYYPESLSAVKNPPKVLFAKGNLSLLKNRQALAIVGSRETTNYGFKVAEKITAQFTNENHVIVSGLALGIDTVAHASCLTNDGSTIAVLAHGLHRVHPSSNTSLAHAILAKAGLWISEHPFGVEPQKHFFVLRNRIQVGLSMSSIIVESNKKSGTMTHAVYCIKANHPLYVVLPPIDSPIPPAEGNLWLFKERGAIPLRVCLEDPKILVKE